ncbi:MAG: hypothetical protein JXB48_20330 [Candidatus Latescibacteria bacterium]|nr:hypothetical protein [Candidatus Latescibacterota bacterium]
MNRTFILVVITIMFINVTISLSAVSTDEEKALIDKITSIKNESALKKLIGDNINQLVTKWKFDYSKIFCKVLKKHPSENTTKSIVCFLKDTVISSKYSSVKRYLNMVLADVITSSEYSSELKNIAMKAFEKSPRDWNRLTDYFLKPENQKIPLFNEYLKWRLDASDESSFDFISKVFDNTDERNKIRIVRRINIKTENNETKQVKFLKAIAVSEKYDARLKNLAKKRIDSLKKGTDQLVAQLSQVNDENEVKELLADKLKTRDDWQGFDYNIFKKAIEQAESQQTKKILIRYLTDNEYRSENLIGKILADFILSPKYSTSLKMDALTIDAIRNSACQNILLEYFSNSQNKQTPLYQKFFNLCLVDSSDDDSLAFIEKDFDNFDVSEQQKIVKEISLTFGCMSKKQIKFFKDIISSKKYNNELKKLAKAQLQILISRKQEEEKKNKERQSKLFEIKNGLYGIERAAKRFEKREKPITLKEIKKIDSVYNYMEELFVFYEKEKGVDIGEIKKAKEEFNKLRIRIDNIIKSKNNHNSSKNHSGKVKSLNIPIDLKKNILSGIKLLDENRREEFVAKLMNPFEKEKILKKISLEEFVKKNFNEEKARQLHNSLKIALETSPSFSKEGSVAKFSIEANKRPITFTKIDGQWYMNN